MLNLLDKNIAYLLISPEKTTNTQLENHVNCERLCSILYSKGFTILPIQGYYNQRYEKSFLAFTDDNNDDLRFESIYLMDMFQQDSIIVKYRGEDFASKVFNDGSEKTLSLAIYDSEGKDKSYLYNGLSFTFLENKKYFFPNKKEDIKNGMIVEYFNNNKWNQKKVTNVEMEYEKMFKLLMKYEKLRIECK